MAFLRTVPVAEADAEVRTMYARYQEQRGYVPNYAKTFSLRPNVVDGWLALNGAIRGNMSLRDFELATFAAARAMRSSYCMLAHGSVLADQVLDPGEVARLGRGEQGEPITERERAMMAFAAQVARDAASVTAADVEALRSHGLSDREIFDVAATAAARCFFSKLLDALGTRPDSVYASLAPDLLSALTPGRPLDDAPTERLADPG
jgi:uncharacterized peroxidase-related enzyme